MTAVEDPLLAWRPQFPILERTTYLVSHSLGAMPRAAAQRLQEYTDTWASRGVRAWAEGWWRMPITVGDAVGRIIGAPPGSVVMHQNVSVCEALILSCFDFSSRRNRIVYEGLNFPSVMYVYEAHRALGAEVVTVESEDGITVPLDRYLAAIDERTLLVPLSHVIFKSAFIQDVPAIVRRAHEVGALVVADLYQSAGAVPVDVAGWDVDFATGGSVKWLCGGPGAGYLYVAPRLRGRLAPRLTGWMAHRAPFAFETGAIEYADDATRFLHGTPAVLRGGHRRRRRRHPREVRAAGPAPRRSRPRAWLPPARARAAGAARRHGDPRRAARPGRHARAAAPRGHRGFPSGRGHPLLPALLHDRRRDLSGARRDAADSGFGSVSGARGRGRDGFLKKQVWPMSHAVATKRVAGGHMVREGF